MDTNREKMLSLVGAVLLIAIWIFTPLISQYYYGYSAIEVSFGITAIYFIGFQLWKFWN